VKTFFNSMLGRMFLILIGGIIISVLITEFLAGRERQEMLSQFHRFRATERVIQFISLLDTIPVEARPRLVTAAKVNGIFIKLLPTAERNTVQDIDLTETLRQRLGAGIRVTASMPTRQDCPPLSGPRDVDPPRINTMCQTVNATLHDGTPVQLNVRLITPVPRVLPPGLSFPGLLLFVFFVGTLAYVVAHMATRPLRMLAQAATDFGRDIRHAPMMEEGPTEVRRAAEAFNIMQTRIRHSIHERTYMLAAISHDLQTPLTRLRLRLEKVKDEDLRNKLVADMESMQHIIREGLDLAHSMYSGEAIQTLDLDSVLESLCADHAESGEDVSLTSRTNASLRAQPVALRRCLENMIINAIKYGGFARITATLEDGHAVIRVRDGGPGIPRDKIETVFEPFRRLEISRSRETGGTGLGLTIARNIAERHNGSLRLRNHPEGGLEAVLELPLTGNMQNL
jgi:signal transduction histidine kinase